MGADKAAKRPGKVAHAGADFSQDHQKKLTPGIHFYPDSRDALQDEGLQRIAHMMSITI